MNTACSTIDIEHQKGFECLSRELSFMIRQKKATSVRKMMVVRLSFLDTEAFGSSAVCTQTSTFVLPIATKKRNFSSDLLSPQGNVNPHGSPSGF